jgi:hypothetical protein
LQKHFRVDFRLGVGILNADYGMVRFFGVKG